MLDALCIPCSVPSEVLGERFALVRVGALVALGDLFALVRVGALELGATPPTIATIPLAIRASSNIGATVDVVSTAEWGQGDDLTCTVTEQHG